MSTALPVSRHRLPRVLGRERSTHVHACTQWASGLGGGASESPGDCLVVLLGVKGMTWSVCMFCCQMCVLGIVYARLEFDLLTRV